MKYRNKADGAEGGLLGLSKPEFIRLLAGLVLTTLPGHWRNRSLKQLPWSNWPEVGS